MLHDRPTKKKEDRQDNKVCVIVKWTETFARAIDRSLLRVASVRDAADDDAAAAAVADAVADDVDDDAQQH